MKVKEMVLLPVVMAVLAFVAVEINAGDYTNAASSVLSENVATLNTQSYTTATIAEDKGMDTRSYTEDWSMDAKLNTKRIIGTILRMR